MPDVLRPERPVDAPGREPFHGYSTACLRHRRTKRLASAGLVPADEGEVLRAEEHAAVQADERQPLGFAPGRADPNESVRRSRRCAIMRVYVRRRPQQAR